ncbi:MAG: N-formylglutamate amidohydrolase [Rhodocyclaceae bacterium]|nr:N-formylglutamate amidohydrolase [Rhodocyclaceae bacterium]
MPPEPFFLVTCEHAGNRVPARYRNWFQGWEEALASHRGHDPGALAQARDLARALAAPLVYSTVSRLVVELNRSPRHPRLLSEAWRAAPREVREEAVARYYRPYRERAGQLVAGAIAGGRRVVHISSHSFTPVLDGEVRNADIGLLYHPGRPGERALCDAWQAALETLAPRFRVRRNYPYTGKSDGFCSWLRRRFGPGDYVGIELEINQKHCLAGGASWRELRRAVVAALVQACGAG